MLTSGAKEKGAEAGGGRLKGLVGRVKAAVRGPVGNVLMVGVDVEAVAGVGSCSTEGGAGE